MLKFAISIIAGNIVLVVTSLLNMRLLGKFDHSILYILTMFSPVYYFLLAFQESFRSSAIVIASRYKKGTNIRYVIKHILLIALICNIIVAILFCSCTDWITQVIHVSEVLKDRFEIYSKKMVLINFILMFNIVLNAMMLGLGFHRLSMLFNMLTCVSTTILLIFQINYLHQGLDGLVIASSIINLICGLMILTLISHCIDNTQERSILNKQTYCKNKLLTIIRVLNAIIYKILFNTGSPVFLSYLVMFIGFTLFNSTLTQYGVDVVSGYGVACRLQLLVILPAIGLGSAMAILINHRIMLNKHNGILRTILQGMSVSSIIYGLFAIAIHHYDAQLVALFVSNEAVKNSAIYYFNHVAYSYFISGPVIAFLSMLEQIGYACYALILNGFYFLCVVVMTKLFMRTHDHYQVFYQIISFANFLSLITALFFIPILIKRFKKQYQI